MKSFEEDLKLLVDQVYEAGEIHANWCDGGLSNEDYEKSEQNLEIAVKEFLNKYMVR